jgi:ribosomal protein L37E
LAILREVQAPQAPVAVGRAFGDLRKVRDPLVQRAYIYTHCRLCGRPKGRSNRPLCPSCGHRVPKMDGGDWPGWRRDSAIVSLYFNDVSAALIARAFGLTRRRVLQIIANWSK